MSSTLCGSTRSRRGASPGRLLVWVLALTTSNFDNIVRLLALDESTVGLRLPMRGCAMSSAGDVMPCEDRMYVDGTLRLTSSGASIDNVNPATGEVIGSVTNAGAGDMEDAIAAARR